MSNHMKFCSCHSCRYGRHASGSMIQSIIRKFRRQAKQDLKQGKVPNNIISVPYTD